MKSLIIILGLLGLNAFSNALPLPVVPEGLQLLDDNQLSKQWGKAAPAWIENNDILANSVKNPEDLLTLLDFAKEMKDSAEAGIPQELSIAINTQNFLDDLIDPNEELDYLGRILEEIFRRAGVKFDLTFEDTKTRGNYEMIYYNTDGTEIFRHDRIDFIGRLSIENIRFGDTETSIGNIYISNWDWAPGNVMRIQVRD